MKSAYELAMERLRREEGESRPLTDDQKRRLTEVGQDIKAKIAERELALQPEIEAAMAKGEWDEAEKLRGQLAKELGELRAEEETRKEAIRAEEVEGDDAK